jgi:acyl-CoA thioesterase I
LSKVRTAVYFFGDSFVAGFGDPTGHGWVGRVQAAAAEDQRFVAVNRGVPGATSIEVVRAWVNTAERLPADGARDTAVVFSFGTNDVIAGLDSEQSLAALAEALALAEAAVMPAFVVGPPPVGDLPEADLRLAALSDEMDAICARLGVPFVATHRALKAAAAWTRETAAGDGSHPQADGYRELAELVIAGGFFDWLADIT